LRARIYTVSRKLRLWGREMWASCV